MFKLTKKGEFKYINTKYNKNIFVTPFITDTHLHLLGFGEKLVQPSLENKSLPEIKEIIINILKKNPDKIILRGWSEEFSIPDKKFLDDINEDIPIMLVRRCGHKSVVNSKVFEQINFKDFEDYIEFEKGFLKEKAIDRFYETFGAFTNIKDNYESAKTYLNKKGYNFVHSDDLHGVSKEELPFLNDTDFFVYEKVAVSSYDQLLNYYDRGYFKIFKSVKIYLDGSLGARTAYLIDKYNDSNTFGEKLWEDSELNEIVRFCESKGLHLAVHAIGDGAVEQILKVFEEVKPKLIHRIIHGQILREKQIEKIKRYNLIIDVQPQFIESDKIFIKSRLGNNLNNTFKFYELYKNNIPLFISSDAPVEEPDWLRDMKKLKELGIPYNYSLFRLTYSPEIVDNINREESIEKKALIFNQNPFDEISVPKLYSENSLI